MGLQVSLAAGEVGGRLLARLGRELYFLAPEGTCHPFLHKDTQIVNVTIAVPSVRRCHYNGFTPIATRVPRHRRNETRGAPSPATLSPISWQKDTMRSHLPAASLGRFALLVGAWLALVALSAQELRAEGAPVDRAAAQASAARVLKLTPEIQRRIDAEYGSIEALYKHLHAHPELSRQEEKTSARIAKELREAGFEVTENVGGFGVVGVLKNGPGKTVMVRADMDGLPIFEKTGLPYASQARGIGPDGNVVGVMHACGHDLNMANLIGTARILAALREHWSGTLLFIGQPAEETGAGARMMIEDGLLKRFPRPDLAFALHCDARYQTGHVNYRAGQMQSNVDSVDITIRGKGGHGAAPHTTIDPVVLAARVIVDLQTIVAREVNPLESAVVTVGSIHGGTKHNIIPDDVKLQLTVRTTNEAVRRQVLEAIERITKAVAASARAPEPVVTVDEEQFTPALYNDPALSARTVDLLKQVVGQKQVHERPMSLGGEDFSRFLREGIPGFYYFLGSQPVGSGIGAASADKGAKPLTRTHTAEYYPVPEPTLKTGMLTMTSTVLNILGK